MKGNGKASIPGIAIGLSIRRSRTLGWPIRLSWAIVPLSKRPSIAASETSWCLATSLAWASPVGKAVRNAAARPMAVPERR